MRMPPFNFTDLLRHVTLTVTVRPPKPIFKARLAIGLWIIRVGAWVIGFGKIDVRDVSAEVRDESPRTCSKCGSESIKLAHIEARPEGYIGAFDRDQDRTEHLRNTCQTCNYVWTTPCRDSR